MTAFFRLSEHGTTASKEILCGVTAFLTMSYILFVNTAIVSGSGMPPGSIFAATAIAAALCSILMGLVANAPFGMAPGMGLNTFFTYVVCTGLGFDWREALALVFICGLIHVCIMATDLRKALVNAIPQHLKLSFGVGLGLFIGYTGLKSAGFLMFTTPPGQYEILADGTVLSNSSVVPSLVGAISASQAMALIGLAVMLMLLALERKTGESYAALPVGMLAATFIGIPLQVTDIFGVKFIDLNAVLEIKQVLFAFFGDPGLLSLFSSHEKILKAAFVILILLVVNVMDTVGTIIGIGQAKDAEIFSDKDMARFGHKGGKTKLDRALLCNSFGGVISSLLGTTTVTTYMESITGIVAGGRTGLAAVTVGVMFLICLPLAHFISVIPPSAIAPALIVAGAFMVPLAGRINWHNFEEAFPAFATAMCIPMTYGFVYGIAAGTVSHVLIQISVGKWRSIHPMLYVITLIFLLVVAVENWL
ncbi:NCS2 family permease [Desulfovibrio sp. OttesenSCG-928-G11]|nr:NCS2 family permease [Desulfovibrio sp. OttesenSCG-928-G11]